ncbi:MAG TPA: alpha-2-macroglobulin, partial [Acetobacteraceae bacterium]|nr:alpha-2-macroglobulin [Acetobacteraceae bacterium]
MRRTVWWIAVAVGLVLSDVAVSATTQAAAATAPETPPAAPAALAFQRLLANTGGTTAEMCFRFSQPLDPRAEAHYADYLHISPRITPAVRVDGKDLCLSGLGYGTSYTVTLLKGLPSASGARLPADQRIAVSLADRPALVAISGAGFILPRNTANGVTISTVNVDRVRIHVFRMSEPLLVTKIAGSHGMQLGTDAMDAYELRDLMRRSLTAAWSGTMDVRRDHNRTVETAFPLAGIIRPDAPGAYLVVAENAEAALPAKFFDLNAANDSDDYYGISLAAHWVVATDIALTTMTGRDGLHVFARSLASAMPLAGITLVLSSVGQDVLDQAVTDADGEASFSPGLLRGNGGARAATVSAHGPNGDFTLLNLNRPAFDFSDRGVSGRPSAGPIEAFLATERGIYRPGETVNVTALLRNPLGAAIDNTPLTLVLRRPDGVEARRVTLDAVAAGGFHQALALTGSAARGQWSVEALVDPSGDPIGRVQFDVQDFVPQQLKVTLHSPEHALQPGGAITATLDGQFLYGAPAAGLHGEADLRIVRDENPVAAATGYQFGLVDEDVKEVVQKLDMPDADAAGTSTIEAKLQPPAATSAPLKGILTAGLFEPSGRIVQDRLELPIRNQKLLIGVRSLGGAVLSASGFGAAATTATFDVRTFDASAAPIARADLHWSVVRENRVFDWFQTGRAWTFHYHTVDEPIFNGSLDVPADAPGVVTQALDWGHYRLVVSDPATGAASSVRFDVGWAATAGNADTPDKVEVSAQTPNLVPGQTTRVHIRGPFAGQAQVTVAGDRVFETHSLAVPATGADLDITARAEWGSGAYVLVSMYRPLEQPARPHDPVRAVGVVWLGIDAAPHKLSVSLGAPVKVLPRRPIRVPLRVSGATAGEPTWVTVAAVDEGILQLTRFAAPDPVGFFFGKRRLGVDMRDDYGRLLDGSAAAGPIREGGDEGIGGPGLPVTSTKIVSLFTGPVALGKDGSGEVTLQVPDFEGQLRLMALAWNHDAVGAAESRLIVRDPVFADLALPRFLAPGDTARMAVSLANTDGPAGDYHLDVAATGSVRTDGAHVLDVSLAAPARRVFGVGLAADRLGIGTVSADLSGPNGYKLHRDWQIAVRPAHAPITLAQTALQAPGETFRLDPHQLGLFLPGSLIISVGYAGYAGIDTPSLLQSLYQYPFGCTEQLVSAAWPLIYLNDPGLLGRVPRDAGAKAKVQHAIDTIIDREDPAGRFGLWRVNDGQASPWLDAYAVDFLMHAKDGGFTVPDPTLDRAEGWLAQEVQQSDLYADDRFGPTQAESRAYGLYVLARAGRGDLGAMRRMHDTVTWSKAGTNGPRLISWGEGGAKHGFAEALGLAHLAGALSLMGDRARAHDTFAMAVANLGARRSVPAAWFDFTYWSYARDLAGVVAIAADSGENDLAQSLIDRFGRLDLTAPRLNTQEKASLLAAAHALNRDEPGRALTVNARQIAPLKLPAALAPDAAEVQAGFAVTNAGSTDLWRT